MAVPSDAHLLAFGRLVHNFAYCEFGIKLVMGGIMRTGIDETAIALQPYSANDVRNAAKALAKEKLKPEYAEPFCQIVGDWYKHNGLRNTVAHSRWTAAERPGALRPQGVSIREGKAKWLGIPGIEDGADGYTSAEIEGAAADLATVGERLKSFIRTSGLQPITDEATPKTNERISSSSGIDGSNGSK